MFIRDCSKNHTRETEKQILDAFTKEGTAYLTIYAGIPDLKEQLEGIVNDFSTLHWWKLSWRAIVPFYVAGYRITAPKTNSEDEEKTADLIAQFIQRDANNITGTTDSVMSKVRAYKQSVSTSADEDQDGICDSQQWLDGTIFADWQPSVNEKVYFA